MEIHRQKTLTYTNIENIRIKELLTAQTEKDMKKDRPENSAIVVEKKVMQEDVEIPISAVST